MLFNSLEFIIFLLIGFFTYYSLPLKLRKCHLLTFSYLFYLSWNIPYTLLLFVLTILVYFAGKKIETTKSDQKKQITVGSCVAILVGILFFYKFFQFTPLSLDLGNQHLIYRVIIPIGISYYTFRLISYLIDIYWTHIEAEKDFAAFALYISFFPHILSGPIERAGHFLPQIKNLMPFEYSYVVSGLRLILFGFFKKLVIADRLSLFINTVYNAPATYNSFVLLMAAYGFMIQLYADFSGLTDIARGCSRLFGIESKWNFNLPFFAPNLQQFWRRWHMTLTQWLADYVFKPLNMTLRNWGNIGLVMAVMINMTLIGLWHGFTLNYLIFGLIHGIFLTISVLTLKKRDAFFKKHSTLTQFRSYLAPFFTFNLVVFVSIFFRADTFHQAISMISNILNFSMTGATANFFPKKEVLLILSGIILMEAVHYLQSNKQFKMSFYRKPIYVRWGLYYCLVACVLIFGQFASSDFIYFKF